MGALIFLEELISLAVTVHIICATKINVCVRFRIASSFLDCGIVQLIILISCRGI